MKKLFLFLPLVLFVGCSSVQKAQREDNMTVGIVQREITVGMPASRVAEILGSPNIVTTDENRNEVWIYDKIRSEVSYSNSGGGAGVGGGGTPLGLIIGGLGFSGSRGDSVSSKKTLTVIIKFDSTKRVRDFAYHTSRF